MPSSCVIGGTTASSEDKFSSDMKKVQEEKRETTGAVDISTINQGVIACVSRSFPKEISWAVCHYCLGKRVSSE